LAKPFSIQAPEDIAKEYAGNKQKIAQAAQMGTIDPTAAVLAGMFIDRMRSAQVMEGAQQPTVAQQVLGGVPPQGAGAPPPPMGAPPAGLGATPEAAAMPPMAPPPQDMAPPPQDMAPPPPEMDMVPQGMADGGLAMLPVPDTMFDEPTNGGFDDGYAGGGMVAFAPGGMANLYDDVEYFESGGNQDAVSKAGARGVMQLMPGTMKDPGFGVPTLAELRSKGLSDEEANRQVGQKYLDAMYRKYGDEATALAAYNWGPGNVDKWLKKGGDPKQLPTETRKYISNILGGKATPKMPERDIDTAEGRASSREDIFEDLQRRFGRTEKEQDVENQRMARAEEMASPEYYEAQRKDSMWETLASIGFNMASSKSPYLLQAVGEAAAAAMPGARADKKERKALKDRALDIMGDINDKSRKENLQLFGMAVELGKEGLQQEQFEKKLELDERQVAVAEKNLNEQIRQANLTKPEDINDTVTRYLLVYPPGSPQHEAAKRVYAARNPSSTTNTVDPKAIVEAGRQGAGGFSEGQTAKDTKGRTIVFQGGQWVYP
jgi:hypothetical protein